MVTYTLKRCASLSICGADTTSEWLCFGGEAEPSTYSRGVYHLERTCVPPDVATLCSQAEPKPSTWIEVREGSLCAPLCDSSQMRTLHPR